MRDVLLAIAVGLYALWGYSVIRKVDIYLTLNQEEEQDEAEKEVQERPSDIIGILQRRLLSWYRHPRLSRFLFRILMHL